MVARTRTPKVGARKPTPDQDAGAPAALVVSERLELLERGRAQIEQARGVAELKGIRDKAEALRVYLREIGESRDIQNAVAEIKLRAERRAGDLLAEMAERGERAGRGGDRKSGSKSHDATLNDTGITKSNSSRWQAEARVPEEAFQRYVAERSKRGDEVTQAGLLQIAKLIDRDARLADANARQSVDVEGLVAGLAAVAGQWRTIYADPPWSYGDGRVKGGGVELQYRTMTLDDICGMPVGALAHPDGAHLWMWTTWPMIREGAPHKVLDAWGFRWVGEIVWRKVSKNHKQFFGVGRWLRPSTEVLVLGVERGRKKPPPLLSTSDLNGCREMPVQGHSRKPEFFRGLVEKLSPGPRIELFARRKAPGWGRWGNEA